MQISVISFTSPGAVLAGQLEKRLSGHQITVYQKPEQGLVRWAGEQFAAGHALVFIGACGIAVRAIAPYVKDKLSDSPVLVMDEQGHYVIPILSGHVGGANELAVRIASVLEADAVITTATDLNHTFAVDLFAKRNHLRILNKDGIARVSAKVLRGEKVSISIENAGEHLLSAGDPPPKELSFQPYPPKQPVDILISSGAEKPELREKALLSLKPREYVLGIGCRKGKKPEEIAEFIRTKLTKIGVHPAEIAAVTSIDRKKDEAGICAWADACRIPFVTFSEEELRALKGKFHGSSFVEQTVGVDNVCERSALAFCRGTGRLVLEKQAENGITLAVARREWKIDWERKEENET